MVCAQSRQRTREQWFVFLAPWVFTIGTMIYLSVGVISPQVLANQIRAGVSANAGLIVFVTLALLLILALAVAGQLMDKWRGGGNYLCTATGLALFAILLMQVVASASFNRVSKPLAQAAAPFFSGQERLAFYDTYLEGVPFYLQIKQPAWLVQARQRTSILASNYLAARRPPPKAGYGPVLLSYDEFAAGWKNSKAPLLVIVKEKNLPRLSSEVGATVIQLTRFGEYLLVTNR